MLHTIRCRFSFDITSHATFVFLFKTNFNRQVKKLSHISRLKNKEHTDCVVEGKLFVDCDWLLLEDCWVRQTRDLQSKTNYKFYPKHMKFMPKSILLPIYIHTSTLGHSSERAVRPFKHFCLCCGDMVSVLKCDLEQICEYTNTRFNFNPEHRSNQSCTWRSAENLRIFYICITVCFYFKLQLYWFVSLSLISKTSFPATAGNSFWKIYCVNRPVDRLTSAVFQQCSFRDYKHSGMWPDDINQF